tara:strand:- start:176 stop:418 length:243 start_codon:yes stop_codon:yes gene_type:complete
MASKDTIPGNTRTPYKIVVMITLWVDDNPDHEALVEVAQHVLTKEIFNLVDGAGFQIGETGQGFETTVDSVDMVKRSNLN